MLKRCCLIALCLALLVTAGCKYNGHRNMGATETIGTSELNDFAKPVGVFLVAIPDAVLSPFTMLADRIGGNNYNGDHHYFSYSGSRVIADSHMGLEYQWLATAPTILIETVWLIITGPVDLITVLNE